jgi:uncharacterized protein YceK
MNRFIGSLEIVTTRSYHNYKITITHNQLTLSDWSTTNHSTLDLLSPLSLVFVTALNNGCSFTVLSLSVSWQLILAQAL